MENFLPFPLPSSRTFAILYTSGTYQKFVGSRVVVLILAWGGSLAFGGGSGGRINPCSSSAKLNAWAQNKLVNY